MKHYQACFATMISSLLCFGMPTVCFAEETTSNNDVIASFSDGSNDTTRQKVLSSVTDNSILNKLNSKKYLSQSSTADCLGTVSDIVDNSNKNGTNLKYSEGIDGLFQVYVPQTNAVNMSDMNTGSTDKGTLNLQYMNLINNISNQYYDAKSMKGKATDCESLFSQTYGDLESQIQLSDPEIPESFNPTSMLESASQSIQNTYGEGTSSGTFSTVKNNLSIGDCFSQAKQQQSMPSLYSKSTMKGYLNNLSSGNKSQMQSELKGYNVKGKAIKDSTDKSWMSGLSNELGIVKQEYNASPYSVKQYLLNDQGTTSGVDKSHYKNAMNGLYAMNGSEMQKSIDSKREGFVDTYKQTWFEMLFPLSHKQNKVRTQVPSVIKNPFGYTTKKSKEK